MGILLFAVILGLFATAQSTPVNTVTQIPTKADDDVFREAVTEGFLVKQVFLPSLTSEAPKTTTTAPFADAEKRDAETPLEDVFEGSAAGGASDGGEQFSTMNPSSTSTLLRRDTDDSASGSSTTRSPQASLTSPGVPNVDHSSVTEDHSSRQQTTDPAVPSFMSFNSGSGDGELPDQFSSTSSSVTSVSNTESGILSSVSRVVHVGHDAPGSEDLGSGSGMSENPIEHPPRGRSFSETVFSDKFPEKEVSQSPESPAHKGHVTPDWIIILGFIVGVAALVMLCVAIATRDKWNGPTQASQKKNKTDSSHQKKEVEMETFLPNDSPKEYGKSGEYTVIPLEELPEAYSH